MVDEDVASAVAEALAGRSVATAESCTAGRVVEALAGVAGAATFLCGGVVAYQEAIKRNVLGVSAPTVFCADAAAEMAAGVAALLGAGAAIATTGVVAGDAVDGVEPGTVFIATSVDGDVATSEHHFEGSAEQVCDAARRRALLDLLDHLHRISAVGPG